MNCELVAQMSMAIARMKRMLSQLTVEKCFP